MEEEKRILFANESFYQAFSAGDFRTMEDLWSRYHPLICIHPGHAPLLERDEIMISWKSILKQGSTQSIGFHEPRVSFYNSFALVICYEAIFENHLIATNGFVEEDEVWKMVLHQAGPTVGRPRLSESVDKGEVLN